MGFRRLGDPLFSVGLAERFQIGRRWSPSASSPPPIIDINHEPGNLTQYTSAVTGGGDLSVAAGAALAGTAYGLSVLINDTTAIYGQKNITPNVSGILCARVYNDINSLTMANNDSFEYLKLYNNTTVDFAYATLIRSGGAYYFRVTLVDDGPAFNNSPTVLVTDQPHRVEILVVRATTAISANGYLSWWIDGVPQTGISGKNNYNRFIDFSMARLGALALDAGTSGTLYLDELVINDTGAPIGPVPGSPI